MFISISGSANSVEIHQEIVSFNRKQSGAFYGRRCAGKLNQKAAYLNLDSGVSASAKKTALEKRTTQMKRKKTSRPSSRMLARIVLPRICSPLEWRDSLKIRNTRTRRMTRNAASDVASTTTRRHGIGVTQCSGNDLSGHARSAVRSGPQLRVKISTISTVAG